MNANKVTFALTVLLLAVAPNLQAAKCSNASLKGIYTYSIQGFAEVTPDISPAGFVPFAQTGLVTCDGKGNVVSGTFTDSTTIANRAEASREHLPVPTPSTGTAPGNCKSTLEMAPSSTSTWWFRDRQDTRPSTPIPVRS